MIHPERPDEPSFDIVQFEVAAKARAAEFVGHVARLAVFEISDEPEYPQVREDGAEYELTDGGAIAVKYEQHPYVQDGIIAKARVIRPPVEILGHDGKLRRVTLTRHYLYESFLVDPFQDMLEMEDDFSEDNANSRDEDIVLEEKEYLEDMEAVGQHRLEEQMRPNWMPDELIWTKDGMLVEIAMTKGLNFVTERFAESMPDDTKLAHWVARRQAGELPDQLGYTLAEHKALMAQLSTLDPSLSQANPLYRYFDQEWLQPKPTTNSWMPGNNI